MDDAPPRRRRELEQIAISCRRIAHRPPESFRDAIQLAWFMDVGAMHGDQVYLVVPGHLDRTLLPFYQRDRAAGALSDAEALALIESLYILINEYIPDGLAISVMVGGRDALGRDVTNPLSYLCLEALRRTRLVYPTVGICWHEGTPADLSELGIDLVAEGLCNVAFFGDETIQRGLTRLPPGTRDDGQLPDRTADVLRHARADRPAHAGERRDAARRRPRLRGHQRVDPAA